MSTIGPLVALYEADFINREGFRDACRSPVLPREQRRFLGLQYLKYFHEEVTEEAIDSFLVGSDVPWTPPAPIGELTPEEKRALIKEVLETFGVGFAQVLWQLLYEPGSEPNEGEK